MNAEPPVARFQMEHQPRRPGYARRSPTHMKIRYVAVIGIVSALLAALLAVGPRNLRRAYILQNAEPATAASPTIPWSRHELLGWSYSMQLPNRSAYFAFTEVEGDTAIATIGEEITEGYAYLGELPGPLFESTLTGFFWKIDRNGRLLLSNVDTGEPEITLALIRLENELATVWNQTRGESEFYFRSRFAP